MGTIAYFYSNVAIPDTVGGSGVSSTDTLLTAGSLAPNGYPQQFPFKLRLDPRTPAEEVVKVVGGAGTVASPWIIGTVLGVASVAGRGWDGSLATGHAAGAAVEHGMSQEDLALSRAHEAADSTGTFVNGMLDADQLPHGLPSAAWQPNSLSLIQAIVTPAGNTTSVTFNAIPQSYTHLLLVAMGKSTSAGARDVGLQVQINGDATARYQVISNYVTDGSPSGAASTTSGDTSMGPMVIGASAVGAPSIGAGFAFFPFYSSPNFNKSTFGVSGAGQGGTSGYYSLRVRGCFYNPPAQAGITAMTMFPSAGQFKGGCIFSLYGLL
jgi:hypothetical protein